MIEKLLEKFSRSKKSFMLYAFANGKTVQLDKVKDEVFSTGMLGRGIAIQPSDGKLYAPCDGQVGHIFDTKHAINIISDFGSEILLHIGLDTVKLKGKGFELKVKEGDRVNKGDLLCVFDIDVIKNAQLLPTTPMVITNSDSFSEIDPRPESEIKVGDAILRITK